MASLTALVLLLGNTTEEHPHQLTGNGSRHERTPLADMSEAVAVAVKRVDDIGHAFAGADD